MTRGHLAAATLACLLLAACAGGGEAPSATGPPVTGTGIDAEGVTATVASGRSTSARTTDPVASRTAIEPPAPVATLTWRADLHPLSGPVLADGVLVLYTRDGEGLSLTAVQAQTGEVVWSHPATPSRALVGVGIRVEPVGDDRVVHLEPLAEGAEDLVDSRVVVREAATGRAVIRVGEGSSHYRLPTGCDVPGGEICVYPRQGGYHLPVQALTDDGSTLPIQQSSEAMAYTDPLGPLGLRRMTGQDIGRVQDGELVWSTRTDEVFGQGASTNTGWIFRAVEDDALLVGSVGPVDDPYPRQEIDLRDYTVAAMDAQTGERRWLAEATSLFCDVDLGLEDDPLLACRYSTGVLLIDDDQADYADVGVALVRLDPRTGETLWELPLPSPPDEGRPEVSPLDEGQVIVAGLTVDVADGSARPSTSSETAWEEDDSTVDLSLPRLGSVEVYPSSTWLLPPGVSLDGSGPRWPLPPGVGVEVDGARVVTVDGQLVRWDAP